MSHLTHMKTRFQNLFYLEKALNRLNIKYKREQKTLDTLSQIKLVISQSNGHNVEFQWKSQEYELIADMSFWEQSYPVKNFIERIAQQYAGEVIVGESQKIGFQPVTYQQNSDGSNTLILERWNSVK